MAIMVLAMPLVIKHQFANADNADAIAQQTEKISNIIVDDADAKEFEGKNDISLREKMVDMNFSGRERRNVERNIKIQNRV